MAKSRIICTKLMLLALIALLCVGIMPAAGTAEAAGLPNVTVTSWSQLKAALNTHPDGAVITLGRTILAASSDVALQINNGQNVILDLNGKTLNRNTTSKNSGREGRSFIINSGASLTIRDSVGGGSMTGGHAYGGGCILINSGGSLLLEGGTITQNEGDASAGAIYVDRGATFRMTGGSISGNQCWYAEDDAGGGAILNRGEFIMEGGTISGNISYYRGGAILNVGTVRMMGGSISNNQARRGNGGGIMSLYSTDNDAPIPSLIITGGSITGNTTGQGGGGIATAGALTISNCTVSGNTSTKAGGGILAYANYSYPGKAMNTLIGSGTVIAENTSLSSQGGGLDLWTNTTLQDGAIIRDNQCAMHGGGIAFENYVFRVGSITVTGNSAGSDGGSGFQVYSGASVFLEGSAPVVADNESDDIQLDEGTVLDIACAFSNGARMGVDPGSTGTVFTRGYSTYNTAAPSEFFHPRQRSSEVPNTRIELANDEAIIVGPNLHNITLTVTSGHGTMTAPAQAYDGVPVTVNYEADEGYGLSTVYITNASGIEIIDDSALSFVMPDDDVRITAYFDVAYSITVSDEIAGLVSSGMKRACANQRVRLNVSGELPGLLTYTDPNGHAVRIEPDKDGNYYFTMPRSDTTVTAAYAISFAQPENGRLTVSKDVWNMTDVSPVVLARGAECTISAVPNSGTYSVLAVIAYTENGVEHVEKVALNESYRHTFTMPAANVTVTAVIGERIASTWAEVQSALNAGGDVYLSGSITAGPGDGALTVPAGTSAALHLCGFTADRGLDSAQADGSAIINHGSLTISGPGAITGGNTTAMGGGVYTDGDRLSLIGAAVTGNSAGQSGGVYAAGGAIGISGGVSVTGNAGGNLYLANGAAIDVTGVLSGAQIGIGMESAGIFTNGLSENGDASAFISDSSEFVVIPQNGEAKLSMLHAIAVDDQFITADKSLAVEGETVTLNTEAPSDFILTGLYVTGANGGEAIEIGAGNAFTMPDSDVTVTALWDTPDFGTPDFTLPYGTEEIGMMAFDGAAMSAVYIPDCCNYIGALAFCDCPNLARVRIPANCQIGTGAFDGCGTVYIYGTPGSDAKRYCDENENCIFIADTE